MNQEGSASSTSGSTFGIIAVAICLISLFTIRLFFSMVMIGIVIFAIIGLIKDASKIWSIVALLFAGFLFYSEASSEIQKQEADNRFYSVQYKVICGGCDVTYTNESGGDDTFENQTEFYRTVQIKGDQNISLYARNDYEVSGSVAAEIYVTGVLLKSETSSGEMASASVYGYPKDVK